VADDNEVEIARDVIRSVPGERRNAFGCEEVAHRRVDVLIRAANVVPFSLQHRGERRYGRAADADQVDLHYGWSLVLGSWYSVRPMSLVRPWSLVPRPCVRSTRHQAPLPRASANGGLLDHKPWPRAADRASLHAERQRHRGRDGVAG